jgi:hypothetical protein
MRSIDTLARPVRYAGGAVPANIARLVRSRLASIIAI